MRHERTRVNTRTIRDVPTRDIVCRINIYEVPKTATRSVFVMKDDTSPSHPVYTAMEMPKGTTLGKMPLERFSASAFADNKDRIMSHLKSIKA